MEKTLLLKEKRTKAYTKNAAGMKEGLMQEIFRRLTKYDWGFF